MSQVAVIGSILLFVGVACAGLKTSSLKCEGKVEPLGIDTVAPRLSWLLESDVRGDMEIAYQVQVGTGPGKAALWDSGKVSSSDSIQVEYGGRKLGAGERAYWRVRVWDSKDRASEWSESTWWEMGLCPADWKARWISRPRVKELTDEERFEDDPAPLLRKEFILDKEVARARVYVSGLGYYELRLNGERVGDHVLDPGWTSYGRRVLYSTYDVTKLVKEGANAIGVMLGNGWWNPLPMKMWGHLNLREHLAVGDPRAIVQLVVEFSDGTSTMVLSDDSWKAGDSAILRNNVYLGEKYDARREQEGWDRAGFDDSAWKHAVIATEKVGTLCAQDAPPIRVTRTFKASKMTQPREGVWIVDLGQNFAGWARLRVKGEAGTRVRMRYGELLNSDGTLNGMTSVAGQIKGGGPDYVYPGTGAPATAFQMDEYVLKGGLEEVYTPRFTFHGFRYVELTGYPGKPLLDAVEGLGLNSDVASAGSFSCSNDLINRIQTMVTDTELSNLLSVQSDCPHREKFGYGGDIVASSEMGMLNFDMSRFYRKAVEDLQDCVRPNGGFTETAPFIGIADEGLGHQSGPVEWGTAFPLLQWQLYQYYGDKQLLIDHYQTTKRWIALLKSHAKDNILDNGIGDHETIAPKSRALTGTAFYYLNIKLLSQIAGALGKTKDAKDADRLAQQIEGAFNKKFLDRDTGRYDIATQACQAIALDFGLAPDDQRQKVLDVLTRDITATNQNHLTTGIFGTKSLLGALTNCGRAYVAYNVVNQRTFPGWGYMLDNGATTLWEHWKLNTNTFSHNHPMFGSVSEWFFKGLAGINPAPDAVGFDKIIIKPNPVADLKWVKAEYQSVRGKIVCEWNRQAGSLDLHVTIPVGCIATVYLPSSDQSTISEGGRDLSESRELKLLRRANGQAVLEVLSGDYHFHSAASPASR